MILDNLFLITNSFLIVTLILAVIWSIFAYSNIKQFRKMKNEKFEVISQEKLNKIHKLAEYKVFDKGCDVYFLENGIAVRDSIEVKLVLYSNLEVNSCLRNIRYVLNHKKTLSSVKLPLITQNNIKFIFGVQKLKLFLPNDYDKRKIIFEKLSEILEG